ncbi:MAG: acyl-CoA dehydratase activase [Polyangiales bacterium]
MESGANEVGALARLGVDIGSTTVKLALFVGTQRPTLQTARHYGEAHQTLARMCEGLLPRSFLTGVTGSGAVALAEWNATVRTHEVTALIRAARASHPSARTLIDLGGQDAKVVSFDAAGRPTVAMNDRCAAGTGVTLDRCFARLAMSDDDVRSLVYEPESVLPVSARCGVFAETDIVNLARRGVPRSVIANSLLDAIVRSNLETLCKGVAPASPVLLLGGPNVHVPALVEAWRARLEVLWRQQSIEPGRVIVPDDALFFSAIGAAMASANNPHSVASQRAFFLRVLNAPRLVADHVRLDVPLDRSSLEHAQRAGLPTSDRRGAAMYVGIDAGSTITKAVVIDDSLEVLATFRRESRSPDEDARALLSIVADTQRERSLKLAAITATGYGAQWIAPLVGARECIVETVAHAISARAVAPNARLVCDVGGQDIKVLSLDPRGEVQRFELSSRCIAGVGMALESTARELGVARDRYAVEAFAANRAALFDDACTVFLDSSRVSLQREGFAAREILAGLARAVGRVVVRPLVERSIEVAPDTTVLLQGGVQHNEAALCAQIDALRSLLRAPTLVVHPMPEFAGALGAALHARAISRTSESRVALPVTSSIHVDEPGRCELCENHCPRAILEVRTDDGVETRLLGGSCDAGTFADPRAGARARKRIDTQVPDLLAFEARALFRVDPEVSVVSTQRRRVRVGIPRALSMYRAAPLLRAYLQALGIAPRDVVFSPTTEQVLRAPLGPRAASDPCFPAKILVDHARSLLDSSAVDLLFVPRITHAQSTVRHSRECASCPVVASAPALVRAALGSEITDRRVRLLDCELCLSDRERLRAQLNEAFGSVLGVTRGESDVAFDQAIAAQNRFDAELRSRALALLDEATRGRGVVLVVARPYHVDPSLSHHVGAELQALGYPSLSIRALPRDRAFLAPLFRSDEDPFDLSEAAPDCDNSGAAERIWAARVAARFRKIGVVDLSSFKCAQDPPTYALVADQLERANVPYCALRDLDETRPRASLRIALLTLSHAMSARGLVPWT